MGTWQTRKQAEAAQKFAEVVAEKGTARTFSPCVKQVRGSFRNASATVRSSSICLFCPSVLSLAADVGVVERSPDLSVYYAYMTLNKLLNPQASVIWSANRGQSTYLEVSVRMNR